jgi:hypothetical protein
LAGQFKGLDRDGDGRVSATEFLNFSNVSGTPVSNGASGQSTARGSSTTSSASGTTSGAGAQSRGSTPSSTQSGGTGAAARTNSGSTADAKLFQQLDKNHDGYLTREEVTITENTR